MVSRPDGLSFAGGHARGSVGQHPGSKRGLSGELTRGRLASQDADAFVTTGENATNFAELAECGAHFSPHTLSSAQQKKVLGDTIRRDLKKAEAALRLQGNLTAAPARQFWKDMGS